MTPGMGHSLMDAASRRMDPAPNRVYIVLLACFGLATLAIGWFWMNEKPVVRPDIPPELRELFPDEPPSSGSDLGEAFALFLGIDLVLALSWWVVGRHRRGAGGRLVRRTASTEPKADRKRRR